MPRRKKKKSMLSRYPSWAWWLGGILVVGLYVWAFNFFFVSPTGFRWRAVYGDRKYPEGYMIHGIDISHYQGKVFWETIGEHSKMHYVYMKATEGGDRIDATFERNIQMAHHYGLKVGSYHFYRPLADQQRQLQNFRSQCLPKEQDLLPMIDIESTGGLSTDVFCDSLFYFLDLVETAYHQKPLIYTGRNFYNKHLRGKIDDYKVMIAMYTDQEPVVADDRDITMWQYTGKGRIVGINGYVDKSRFMGDHTLRDIKFKHF